MLTALLVQTSRKNSVFQIEAGRSGKSNQINVNGKLQRPLNMHNGII